jgi:uncharacterized protein
MRCSEDGADHTGWAGCPQPGEEKMMLGMRFRIAAVLCLVGLGSPADAASFPCHIPFLKPAELAICQDTYLSKLDEDTARKVRSLLGRLSYGQYLGLRYWHSRGAEAREQCGQDRQCITMQYRDDNRFLDRLRQCLDGGTQRRTCWRTMLNGNVASPR